MRRVPWRVPTKVVSVEAPALVAAALLLVQALLSVLVVLLAQVLVLQHLVGPVDLQELVVGGLVVLRGSQGGQIGAKAAQELRTAGTHRVFVRVHGQRQLFEGLADLSGAGLSGHS